MNDALPRDLVPLPTQPWDERPLELSLDIDECRTALWVARGNVTKAAEIMKVSSERMRRFVNTSRRLQDTCNEARERLKDIAEDNLFNALTDTEDAQRRDSMTKFVLTNLGQDRGFGNKGGITVTTPNTGKGRLMVVWDDGEELTGSDDTQTIEGEVVGS
jgi:hypothetical protein